MTDEKLLALCDKFGQRALLWRRKFIGLLPEVNRRRLYERRNCQSIFEFAYKLAGLSKEQVQRVLQLEERFADKPALHSLLVEGQVSVSKLSKVAYLATLENEELLAERVKLLPRRALEILVREERDHQRENELCEPLFSDKTVPGNSFTLNSQVIQELNHLQGQGQDVNAILLELLQARRARIAREKEELAQTLESTHSRYIPSKVRQILKEEYGQKCSIATCARPAEEIHHTQRFSLARSHDPHYLAPLCKGHHQLAHAVDTRAREHWHG